VGRTHTFALDYFCALNTRPQSLGGLAIHVAFWPEESSFRGEGRRESRPLSGWMSDQQTEILNTTRNSPDFRPSVFAWSLIASKAYASKAQLDEPSARYISEPFFFLSFASACFTSFLFSYLYALEFSCPFISYDQVIETPLSLAPHLPTCRGHFRNRIVKRIPCIDNGFLDCFVANLLQYFHFNTNSR
jgi:hypothetical protein